MPVIPFSQDELVQALQKIGVSDSMGGLGPQGMAIKGPRAAADFSKLPINAWLNDYLRRVRTGGFKIKEPSKSIVKQLRAKQNLSDAVTEVIRRPPDDLASRDAISWQDVQNALRKAGHESH